MQNQVLKVIDGKYQVLKKKLGKGSFAQTYLTVMQEPYTLLACKMICKKDMLERIQVAEDKDAKRNYIVNSIKNEVNTWKLLTHKNIVRFYDFSETAKNIYFFSEYCEQGYVLSQPSDLSAFINKKGRIPEKEALPIIRDIVNGCEFLYDRNIFHRDLKPENILLSNGVAKITDFGFAKAIEEAGKKDNPTVQTNIGTPYYMCPQILEGEPYSIKCDVWSLGVMMYKILYGFCPWGNIDSIPNLLKAIKKKIEFPKNDSVSAEMKILICKMLMRDEKDRISIKELKSGIQALSEKTSTAMDIE